MKKILALLTILSMLTSAGCADSKASSQPDGSTVSSTESDVPAADENTTPPVYGIDTETLEKLSYKDALKQGTLIFEGKENEGYDSSDLDWLNSAGDDDYIALSYKCDDVTHGGWGVMAWSAVCTSGDKKGADISSYSTETDKERLITYTVAEFKEMFGAEPNDKFTSLRLGAWNGGHIVSLTYIPKSSAAELEEYYNALREAKTIHHTYDGSLSNPNATENTKKVYKYICDTYGKNILTGQQESTWMGSPDYEMNYLLKNTGKLPAIRGLDFMNNDFDGCVTRAKEWWDKGGLVTICWHTGTDFSSNYDRSLADELDWDKALTEGTDEYNALISGMDRAVVPYLQQLEDADVPVLWRPFHEFDGAWFWWGKGGPENFKKLWRLMYDRYTNVYGLDNLIWVLGYSKNQLEMENWYPGDEFVDVIGGDSYDPGTNHDLYESVKKIAADGMPITLHECGTIPSDKEMQADGTKWVWFMTWHTDVLTNSDSNTPERLKALYNTDYYITLDELPDWKN